jgi:tryptophan-rich sensory protein
LYREFVNLYNPSIYGVPLLILGIPLTALFVLMLVASVLEWQERRARKQRTVNVGLILATPLVVLLSFPIGVPLAWGALYVVGGIVIAISKNPDTASQVSIVAAMLTF